jgi:hypothetical protein
MLSDGRCSSYAAYHALMTLSVLATFEDLPCSSTTCGLVVAWRHIFLRRILVGRWLNFAKFPIMFAGANTNFPISTEILLNCVDEPRQTLPFRFVINLKN